MTEKIQITTAHSLYMLYETLPDEIQQIFLQELLTKQAENIKRSLFCSACKKTEEENGFQTDAQANFQDLSGLLTASKNASLEDMQQAVLQRAKLPALQIHNIGFSCHNTYKPNLGE